MPADSHNESVIQRTIDGIQRMISVHPYQGAGEEQESATAGGGGKEPAIEISLASKRHWELEIKIVRDAPRDLDKLKRLLKSKRRQKEEETMYFEDIERLVTQIEMLKVVVLYLVSRDKRRREDN